MIAAAGEAVPIFHARCGGRVDRSNGTLPLPSQLPKAVELLGDLIDHIPTNSRIVTGDRPGLASFVESHIDPSHRPIHARAQCGHRIADATPERIVAVTVHRAVAIGHRDTVALAIEPIQVLLQSSGLPGDRIGITDACLPFVGIDGATAGGAGLIEIFMHLRRRTSRLDCFDRANIPTGIVSVPRRDIRDAARCAAGVVGDRGGAAA